MPVLVPPGSTVGFLGDLAVPAELYWVSREPTPLAGMGYPARTDWAQLHRAGLRHVVCLTHDDARYDPAPLSVTAIGLEDLYVKPGPADPERERALVLRAADATVARLEAGEGVVVHCRGGRGRTGAVLGCALVRLGHDPSQVVTYLDALHRWRGKHGWPESPWQARVVEECATA